MAPVFWLELVLFSVTLIISAALALIVWSFEPKRKLNITFALYAASSAAWALMSIILRVMLGLDRGNTQVVLEGAILCFGLMGVFLLLFTVRYLDLNTRRADQAVAAGIVALIVFSIPLFNHQLVSNPRVSSNGILISDADLAAILVAALLPGVYLIWSTFLFWQERQRTKEPYLAWGTLVLLVGFTFRAVNVLLPALSLAGTLSCCLMGYGIVSRQLFNPLRARSVALQHEIAERRRMEEALRASEARFRGFVEETADGIIFIDWQGIVIEWNDAVEQILGLKRDQALGKPIWDVQYQFLPDERKSSASHERFKSSFLGILQTGQSPWQVHALETTFQRADGSSRVIEQRLFPIKIDRGFELGVVLHDITERKRAEETLLMFQYTIDRASDAVQWLNREGGFEYVNDQACRSLGYTREELLRLHLWDIDPIYPQEHWDKNWQSYQGGRLGGSENLETLHRRKDGSVFPVEVSSNHLWLGDRELHVAVVRDITERKQAEREIQSLARFPAENPNPVLRLNQAGSILYANEASQPLLQDWAVEVGGQAPQFWRDQVADALGSQSQRTVEVKCGKLVYSFVVLPVSQMGYVNLYAIDITERKRTEQIVQLRLRLMEFAATHSLEELLQRTLDEVGELTNSPIGFYHFVEADQRTLSLQAWSTRTVDEFCQAEGKGLHYPIDQAGVWTDCVRERRPVIHNDYPALPHRKGLPEGHAQVTRELVVPILRGDRIVAILGVGNKAQAYTEKDIEVVSYVADVAWELAERKQVESEREVLIRELEAKNAELERFTYTASHDLKSPLVTIMGFLGYLEKDAVSGNIDKLKADVQRVATAVSKMQHLLNELLELSRIGRIINPPEAVLFESIAHEAIDLVRGRLELHQVRVEIAPDLPTVYGDRARLVEVMQNLVDNAAKFMGEQAEPQITIGQRGTARDGKPILFVRDNGIGIEPRYHQKVFGLFDKLDPTSEGTGIGLALVRRIIEVHGGHIWVESAGLKTGSIFYFTLPVKSAI